MATGKARKVIDGDTFQLAGGKRIRPEGYDTPEKGAKGSQKATLRLKHLIQGKTVGLSPVLAVDRGREVRRVTVKGKPLEKLMKPYAKKRK
jgi:endonuclease YncB( thermonuclease family)